MRGKNLWLGRLVGIYLKFRDYVSKTRRLCTASVQCGFVQVAFCFGIELQFRINLAKRQVFAGQKLVAWAFGWDLSKFGVMLVKRCLGITVGLELPIFGLVCEISKLALYVNLKAGTFQVSV
ncbi:MAG: hypothetical protein GX297_03440 [Treponema sp.]|nr:hypothetical protein [Treponema sp.]